LGRQIGKIWEAEGKHFIKDHLHQNGVLFKIHDVEHIDLLRLHDKDQIDLIEFKTTNKKCYYVFGDPKKRDQLDAYEQIKDHLITEGFKPVIRLIVKFRNGSGNKPTIIDSHFMTIKSMPMKLTRDSKPV